MTPVPTLAGLGAVLLLTLLATVATPPTWHPWPQFLAAATVAALLVSRRHGRSLLARPERGRQSAVDVVDLLTPDRSTVGCVDGPHLATTAVEISAGALGPTLIGRDDPAAPDGVGLPLSAIAAQLDQGGVLLEGIDVVTHGRRAADTTDGEVYSALLGPLPVISHRRVHLLLRFDLAALAVDTAADPRLSLETVVGVATERLRRALVHHGVPCRVLDAPELADLHLAAEAEPGPGVGLVVRPSADPRRVADDLTTVRAAAVTEVTRLRRVPGRTDVVDTVTTLGLHGVDPADGEEVVPAAVADTCHRLPTPRVLPVPGEPLPGAAAGSIVRRPVDGLDRLAPTAHGAGQIVGATRTGDACALQLAGPHLRSVLLAAPPAVCRQVAFRAVAVGHRLAVVTDFPDRWRPLLAIGDEARIRIIDPDLPDTGTPVDAVMWDVNGPLTEGRIDAFAGPGGPDVTPPTVIRVDADWGVRGAVQTPVTAPPDLVLDGRIGGWISIEPRLGDVVRVTVVAGPGEDRFVGRAAPPRDLTPSGAAPSASPDRP